MDRPIVQIPAEETRNDIFKEVHQRISCEQIEIELMKRKIKKQLSEIDKKEARVIKRSENVRYFTEKPNIAPHKLEKAFGNDPPSNYPE